MNYDIIIIGGGAAGATSAIYALRANKKVLLLEKEAIGGKIVSAPLIENYPAIQEITGAELSENLYNQVLALGGEIRFEKVTSIQECGNMKKVITTKESYECLAVIIATGTNYKTLGLENEDNFIGKGISFCAICDGFFFKDKVVCVVGGGNTAVSNALELSNICKKIYIIQLLDTLTAEPILINRLKEKKNIEILFNTSVTKIMADEKISSIEIQTNEAKQTLCIDGIFLSIGQIPETLLAKENGICVDKDNYIIVDKNYMTNKTGIFAAGDCVSKQVRQLTTAINDGTISAINAIEYIDKY